MSPNPDSLALGPMRSRASWYKGQHLTSKSGSSCAPIVRGRAMYQDISSQCHQCIFHSSFFYVVIWQILLSNYKLCKSLGYKIMSKSGHNSFYCGAHKYKMATVVNAVKQVNGAMRAQTRAICPSQWGQWGIPWGCAIWTNIWKYAAVTNSMNGMGTRVC